jgi:hypothetical protein
MLMINLVSFKEEDDFTTRTTKLQVFYGGWLAGVPFQPGNHFSLKDRQLGFHS